MKGLKAILGIALATTGLGGAIAVGAVSAEANRVEQANAAGKSVTIITNEPSWNDISGRGLHAWGEGNETKLCGDWNDNQLGKMTLSNGYYRQTVNFTNSMEGCIFRFKQGSTYWQSVNLTISGGFINGKTYRITGVSWNADKDGYKLCNATIAEFAEHTYSYSLNGGSYTNLVQNSGNPAEYCLSANRSFAANDTLSFKKDSTVQTSITLKADGDWDHNNAKIENSTIKVKNAVASGNFYWNINDNNLWVTGGDSAVDGAYYLHGSFNSWKGFATNATTTDNVNYKFENVELSANDILKAFKFVRSTTSADYVSGTSISCDHSAEYPVELVDDGYGGKNAKVSVAGHYDITVNKNTKAYSFVAKDYIDPSVRYTVKIGSASPVAISLKSDSEYQTAEMDLTKGATVTVYNNGVADNTFNLKPIGNNNVNSSKEILFTKHDRIYIDVSAKTIFVGGLPYGGYHMVVNDDFVQMTENMDPLDPSYREFYSEVIDFNQNDIVKFIDTTSSSAIPTIFDITTINSSSISGFSVVGGSLKASKNIECSVYAKIKYGANEVYFGDVTEEVAKAREFAMSFSTAFNSICRETNQDETYVAALASEWSDQKTAFAALATKVQNVLKSATTSHNVQEIRAFISSYQYIAKKYNTRLGNDYNFLNKDLSSVSIESNRATTVANNNNNPLIIVVVSALALVSATGLFFVIKRKKEVR